MEDSISFFYDKENNYLVDENDFMVFSPFMYITPNEFLLFRILKKDMYFENTKLKLVVELIYPKK